MVYECETDTSVMYICKNLNYGHNKELDKCKLLKEKLC